MSRFLQTKWLTWFLIFICVLLAGSVFKLLPTALIVHRKVDNLNAQLQYYDFMAKVASSQKDYYQSDNYLERQARLKLNHKKPDEKVVFIYKTPYTQETKKNDETLTWWQKLKEWFRSKVTQ